MNMATECEVIVIVKGLVIELHPEVQLLWVGMGIFIICSDFLFEDPLNV